MGTTTINRERGDVESGVSEDMVTLPSGRRKGGRKREQGFLATTQPRMHGSEYHGDENKRGDRAEHEAADHCPAQRRVLFAPFAEA